MRRGLGRRTIAVVDVRYAILFLAVAASWIGIPIVGASVLAAAGVLASQGELDIWVVLAVSTAGACVGGYVGYLGGRHAVRFIAGRREGSWHARRARVLVAGRRLYRRWGRLAVFLTPTYVSGALGMPRRTFVLWNALAALVSNATAALGAYGIGAAVIGQLQRPRAIAALAISVVLGLLVAIGVRRRRCSRPGP